MARMDVPCRSTPQPGLGGATDPPSPVQVRRSNSGVLTAAPRSRNSHAARGAPNYSGILEERVLEDGTSLRGLRWVQMRTGHVYHLEIGWRRSAIWSQ